VAVVTLPGAQDVQELIFKAPSVAEYVLKGQSRQVAEVEAPSVVEYFPAPQSRHTVAPVAVEYFPALQSVHVAVPIVCLNLPAMHAKHDPPFGPENPALHWQLVIAVAPATD
jgi:hypothetical protein